MKKEPKVHLPQVQKQLFKSYDKSILYHKQ